MSFRSRLKESRLASHLTQKDVAALIDVAKSTYAGYETGNSEPDMEKIVKLIDIFQIDANYLFQDDIKKTSVPDESKADARLQRIVDQYHSMNLRGQIELANYADYLNTKSEFDKHSNIQSELNA